MQLKATQQFDVSVEGRDSENQVAPLENPVFSVSPAEIGSIVVDPNDPQKATFIAGAAGTGQLSFSADGIVGAGENILSAVEPLEVLPGDAVSVAFNFGPVTDS